MLGLHARPNLYYFSLKRSKQSKLQGNSIDSNNEHAFDDMKQLINVSKSFPYVPS